nr:MAG TPA: hypothetical protein [Siphoviridae sp. ctX8T1]
MVEFIILVKTEDIRIILFLTMHMMRFTIIIHLRMLQSQKKHMHQLPVLAVI